MRLFNGVNRVVLGVKAAFGGELLCAQKEYTAADAALRDCPETNPYGIKPSSSTTTRIITTTHSTPSPPTSSPLTCNTFPLALSYLAITHCSTNLVELATISRWTGFFQARRPTVADPSSSGRSRSRSSTIVKKFPWGTTNRHSHVRRAHIPHNINLHTVTFTLPRAGLAGNSCG